MALHDDNSNTLEGHTRPSLLRDDNNKLLGNIGLSPDEGEKEEEEDDDATYPIISSV